MRRAARKSIALGALARLASAFRASQSSNITDRSSARVNYRGHRGPAPVEARDDATRPSSGSGTVRAHVLFVLHPNRVSRDLEVTMKSEAHGSVAGADAYTAAKPGRLARPIVLGTVLLLTAGAVAGIA